MQTQTVIWWENQPYAVDPAALHPRRTIGISPGAVNLVVTKRSGGDLYIRVGRPTVAKAQTDDAHHYPAVPITVPSGTAVAFPPSFVAEARELLPNSQPVADCIAAHDYEALMEVLQRKKRANTESSQGARVLMISALLLKIAQTTDRPIIQD